ncbi:MAG: TetR/AcrR family transcriptional regulator [Thermonemataceae bacterium]
MQRALNEKAKDKRKSHVLKCAEQIIQEKGLENLSIASVAKKANLAVGTIYLYFPNKEDIIAHLAIKSRKVLLQEFQASTVHLEDSLEKIRGILLAYLDFCKKYTFYYELVSFYESGLGLEESKELLEASKKLTAFTANIIREGKEQGTIRREINEKEFAFLLWGTAVGIAQLIHVKPTLLSAELEKDNDHFYFSYINLIIKSLSY